MTSAEVGSTFEPVAPSRQHLIPHFIGTHSAARSQIAIHRECPEWEILTVPVIAEVEHSGEPGTGMPNLFPRTVLHLMAKQVLNPSRHTERIRHAGRHQSEQRPRRLRRGALPLPAEGLVAIGETRLAPSAVWILPGFDPRHGMPDVRL